MDNWRSCPQGCAIAILQEKLAVASEYLIVKFIRRVADREKQSKYGISQSKSKSVSKKKKKGKPGRKKKKVAYS